MYKVPLSESESLSRVYSGVKKVADIVGATMGALGRHVFIQMDGGGVLVTKDGANTARMINLEDPIENMGARLAIEAALNTADTAGDGTTSTTVMLEAIVRNAKTYVDNNTANRIVLGNEIEKLSKKIIEQIESEAVKISSREELLSIAKISANGDEKIASLVVEAVMAVGADGNMSIIDSPTPETHLDIVSGLRIESGYASPYFINTPRRTCEIENPLIAITNEEFTRVDQIKEMFECAISQNRDLVIFGSDFFGEAFASVLMNLKKGLPIKCVLIRLPKVGVSQQEYLEDIAFVTGGVFISQQKGDEISLIRGDEWNGLFGNCEKITVYSDRTIIAGGVDKDQIEKYSKDLEGGLEVEMNKAHRARLSDRIKRLKSGIGLIYVGAETDSELKERKDRIEDAILAAQSAMKSGYLPGGGVSYYNASRKLNSSPAGMIMAAALTEPIKTICKNAGIDSPASVLKSKPDGFGINVLSEAGPVDMIKNDIIDPTLVVTTAIRQAVKIATIIIKHGGSVYITEKKNV